MKIRRVHLRFLASLILGGPENAYGAFVEEFAMTRAFAYETLQVIRGTAPFNEEKGQRGSEAIRASHLRENLKAADIDRLIEKKALSHGVHPDLVRSVVKVESSYNVTALSAKGAMGLMQLMPGTASDLGVINPWDPEENLEGGMTYLAGLLREFRDVKQALIAYNAGPEVVRKKLAVPHETRRYVSLVLNHFKRSFENNQR